MIRWMKLAVGIGLLAALAFTMDWREIGTALARADPFTLAAATLVLSLNMPISSFKWGLLLQAQGIRPGQLVMLRAYWIGSFAGNYLPGNVGGDVVRAAVIGCRDRLAEVVSSIVVERLTGLFMLLLLAAACLLAAPAPFAAVGLLAPLWLLVLGLLAALAGVVLAGRFAESLLATFASSAGLVGRTAGKLLKLSRATGRYQQRPGLLLATVLVSAVFYSILVLFQLLVLRAVDAPVGLAQVALIAPMIPLVGMLPIAPNGLGLVEVAFTVLYGQLGVPEEVAFAAALLRRAIAVLVSLVGGLFWLAEPRELRAAAEKPAAAA
jgi:glycosyltransferase 2 family protein